MKYYTNDEILNYIDGCCDNRAEKVYEKKPKSECRIYWSKYDLEVKSDIDTYYVMAEHEYGDGNCDDGMPKVREKIRQLPYSSIL